VLDIKNQRLVKFSSPFYFPGKLFRTKATENISSANIKEAIPFEIASFMFSDF
jgi:hypothetical protein